MYCLKEKETHFLATRTKIKIFIPSILLFVHSQCMNVYLNLAAVIMLSSAANNQVN